MPNIDEIINFVIPVILIIIAITWIFYKFGDPLSRFFSWAKGLFSSGVDKAREQTIQGKEIVWN